MTDCGCVEGGMCGQHFIQSLEDAHVKIKAARALAAQATEQIEEAELKAALLQRRIERLARYVD